MAVHVFSSPLVAADLFFVAPLFDPGVDEGGLAATAGAAPVDPDRVLHFIDQAEAQVDRAAFGDDRADMAVLLLTAHLLYEDAQANAVDPVLLATGAAVAGAISSVSVGPVSKAFGGSSAAGAGAFANDPLATSPFGRRFIALRRQLFLREVF